MELNKTMQIDLSYLKTTFSNNKMVVNKVLSSFLMNTPPLIDNLWENINNFNFEEVRMVAHKTKTSFNTVGAKEVADKLNRLEQDALGQDKKMLLSLITEIKTLSKQVFKEVQIAIDQ